MPGSGTVPSPRGLPPVAALHAALGVRRFSFSADHHAGTAEPFRVARPQAMVSNLNDEGPLARPHAAAERVTSTNPRRRGCSGTGKSAAAPRSSPRFALPRRAGDRHTEFVIRAFVNVSLFEHS